MKSPVRTSIYTRGALFVLFRSHLNILGARNVTRNQCHAQGTKLLSAKAQTLVTTVAWLPRFVDSSQNTDYLEVFVVSNRSFRCI